jgi:signal transduction histidine kinase
MEKVMKKTAFDKIVIGFVFLVVLLFGLLMSSSIITTQRTVYSNTCTTLENELDTINTTTISRYTSGEIDREELFTQLQGIADSLETGVWLTDNDNYFIFQSDKDAAVADKDNASDTTEKKELRLDSYVEKSKINSGFTSSDTLGGYFSDDTLVVSMPIYTWNNYRGSLIVYTSLGFKDEIRNTILENAFVPFSVLMLLSMIVLMLISNNLLKPIREIIKTSKLYAQGNFNARVNVNSKNEFGELARYMEEMADELSRSNEYSRKFISNISHDFRSPLTSIKGYIEAMLDGTIPLELHEKYLGIVLNETLRLTKLTEGLLELNNFDTFALQLDKSNFNIRDIITPTINTFEKRCQDKGIFLSGIFLTDNTMVYADRTKIQQVIYNLVDNAIKFTPEGRQITVQVTEKGDKVITSVKDEGVGISKEAQKKVFDRFYKTDPSRGKDKTGTGLGLAITKEIIKAHGEHITLISEEGEGSEFIFSLPKEKDMQVPIKPVHVHNHEQNQTAPVKSNGKFKIKDM